MFNETPDYNSVLALAMLLPEPSKIDLIEALVISTTMPEIDKNKLHDAARRLRIALAALNK